MPLRVIAGSAKGRKLKLVPGDSTRPIMDRVKEALFNIIGRDIYDAVFLDLFAGTGSVGIEALSRGAGKAVFLDLEPKAIKTIQDNLATAKLTGNAVVKRADALKVVAQAPTEDFDIVYIAPPQYKKLWLDVLKILDANEAWMKDTETQFIVQIDPTEEVPVEFKHLQATDQRKYGNTLLWFFASKGVADDKTVEESQKDD
ncbi:MAG: 16S rRNA (guanine(966)-N(2))-methyltransferase RsmD [Anaerolineaceae bacterium]|nr:16S rRNA (guanine(966)-N(2))-methyltransferase RsmD [Anaerolineaceae bacterium]